MLIQRAFQYELRPDGATRRALARFAGAKRFVWNKALQLQNERYALGEKYLNAFGMNPYLPKWKIEHPWMREAHSQVLQECLRDLHRGFKNFFAKRAERPTRKKKGKSRDSFRFPQGFEIEEGNNRVFLPKIGWVRYRNSRALRGVAKNITISRKGDRWFCSIQTEFEVEEPQHQSKLQIGIDLGVCRFATMSDGTHVDPLNALKKHAYRLRRYQRMMSRKKKFSNNWKKAKAKITKEYTRVGDARRDFLQKTTATLAKSHSLICIEDLRVSNMSASASGTLAKPGRKVKQKSGLNKSILDQGWFEFRRMLEYKMRWAGGRVIAVPAMYTSQTCPDCGHISAQNRKTQADFKCVVCGFAANADLVGAKNILAAGLAVFEGGALDDACGGVLELRGPMNQEPTEAILSYA